MDSALIKEISHKIGLSEEEKNNLRSSPSLMSACEILFGPRAYHKEWDDNNYITECMVKHGIIFDSELISYLNMKMQGYDLVSIFAKYDRFDNILQFNDLFGFRDYYYCAFIQHDKIDYIKYFINKNISVINIRGIINQVIKSNNLEIVEIFVSAGYEITQENIFSLIKTKNISIINYAINAGSKLNFNIDYSKIKFTDEKIKIFEHLFSNNLIWEFCSVKSILFAAYNNMDMISILKKYFPDLDLNEIFIINVKNNNIHMIEFLIKLGIDIDYNNSEALIYSYINSRVEVATILINNGASLHMIRLGDLPIVKLFYDNGAKI